MSNGVPVCKMCSSDYDALEKSMRSLVGWPVIFSWNKKGEIWLGSAVLDKPDATILTSAAASSAIRPAMCALSKFLLEQKAAGSIQNGNLFLINVDKQIRRKKDGQLWGQIECC